MNGIVTNSRKMSKSLPKTEKRNIKLVNHQTLEGGRMLTNQNPLL